MGRAEWESEYADFFHANALRLRRVAWGVCGDWNQAEDIVQTAFVRLYPKFASVKDSDPLAYTRRIVVNLCLNRRRRSGKEILTDDVPEQSPHHDAPTVDVAAAMRALPAQQRAVVTLRYLEDLPVHDVAALLGISEGTVKSHTSRALSSLRRHLGDGSTIEEYR